MAEAVKMTEHEEITQILKDEVARLVEALDAGHCMAVRGGYITHIYKNRVIDSNCSKIVSKLVSLGYEYTTNHGHGCRDFYFTKKIEL